MMPSVSASRVIEIEHFLYHEASLLEENRFREWLALLTDDIVYRLPVRQAIEPGTPTGSESVFCLYDDDKKSLEMRTMRLETGWAHSEVPPSVTQRLITNVMVRAEAGLDDIQVSSNFMVHQERIGKHVSTFIGKRFDRLRRSGPDWRIARRDIELAQTILPSTISIFF
jgi:3-phenylpropionate/cinnamic acid dioxygenase small subunit